MTDTSNKLVNISPEVRNYLRGATEECLQFDFLIGRWTVDGSRYNADGELLQKYGGTWRAEYLHDKRIVLDDFTICLPSGEEVSSFVTLRTYSPITNRWEMAGLAAFQPSLSGKWFGNLGDGEMHLSVENEEADGRVVKHRIRFFDIGPDTFRWERRLSYDGGNTWVLASFLIASRSPA